jgi:hypothetical protein
MVGAGPVVWSPVLNNWIAVEFAGSNLVTYDYDFEERVDLTTYLNAFDIVEDPAGRVIFPRYELLYALEDGRLSQYGEPLPGVCRGVEVDRRGRLYAALEDGRIYRLSSRRTTELWFSGPGRHAALAYDPVSEAMILAARQSGSVALYRIPVSKPTAAKKIASLEEQDGRQSLKRLAVGADGGIYLFDWGRNAILRVVERTQRLELLHRNILPSRDITMPSFVYSHLEDAFVVGTLEYYYVFDRTTGERETLAVNNHGADNFAIHENPDGSLLCIHSGQIFKLYRR